MRDPDYLSAENARRAVAEVCRRCGVPVAAVLGPSRDAPFVRARFISCWVLRQAGWTCTDIGGLLNRSRSAVSHAEAVVRDRPDWVEQVLPAVDIARGDDAPEVFAHLLAGVLPDDPFARESVRLYLYSALSVRQPSVPHGRLLFAGDVALRDRVYSALRASGMGHAVRDLEIQARAWGRAG